MFKSVGCFWRCKLIHGKTLQAICPATCKLTWSQQSGIVSCHYWHSASKHVVWFRFCSMVQPDARRIAKVRSERYTEYLECRFAYLSRYYFCDCYDPSPVWLFLRYPRQHHTQLLRVATRAEIRVYRTPWIIKWYRFVRCCFVPYMLSEHHLHWYIFAIL